VRCPDPACVEEMMDTLSGPGARATRSGAWWKWWRVRHPRAWCASLDKLEADLAKALMSLPASKGFEMVPALLARRSPAASIMILRNARWAGAHATNNSGVYRGDLHW